MSAWYILPNGNLKHMSGLEVQPELDWLPTPESLQDYAVLRRDEGLDEAAILHAVMRLANEGEAWLKDNVG